MAEEVKRTYRQPGKYGPKRLGEYPDKIEGYLGCDHNTAGVA
jgi:hypothetical protein